MPNSACWLFEKVPSFHTHTNHVYHNSNVSPTSDVLFPNANQNLLPHIAKGQICWSAVVVDRVQGGKEVIEREGINAMATKTNEMTPMRRQYFQIKENN